ncbi:hypothetical protein DH2020_021649 [Rehmannia glutinosa]|uniref:PROP1-like PPR domain-containing protein n=1 Tax=Rehmannia glutinosa TaxID=99300 RepID=A0ABR0WFI0_REHGL
MPITCNAKPQLKKSFPTARTTHLSTTSGEAILQNPRDSGTRKSKKKALRESPKMIFRVKLDQCSKNGDLTEALRLYNEARASNVQLNVYHYNVLLYLCSARSDLSEEDGVDYVNLEKGFKIFKQMSIDKVERMRQHLLMLRGWRPRKRIQKDEGSWDWAKLRSYGPALFGFCEKGMADKAYEVDSHMADNEVLAEELELSALLKVSSKVGKEKKVYEMMHRLRATVRQVSEETAATLEDWFKSKKAAEVGVENWDVGKVKKGVAKGGGGWHGQGWLGKGNWRVVRTTMNETGVCQSCGEKLVCIDIDPKETENFAKSLAKLASKKEAKTGFVQFQIKRVVNQLRQISPSKKMPLVVLHQNRVAGGPAQHLTTRSCWKVGKRLARFMLHLLESEVGSWHIPTVTGDDLETPRQWFFCATRKRDGMTTP